jgi:hypothetical protein
MIPKDDFAVAASFFGATTSSITFAQLLWGFSFFGFSFFGFCRL